MAATSMTKRTRQAKKSAALSAIAVSIGKQKGDPIYLRLKKYRALWKANKDLLIKKYKSAALQQWAANQTKK